MKSFFNQKHVLVTGACGTVGSEVVRQLLEAYQVAELIGIDNNESEIFFLEHRFSRHRNAFFILGDVRDRDKLKRKMENVDIVFHTPGSSLLTIFNYDEIFGTILNRFIVQAIADYPLTVYGKGGQTRGYLNIRDTLQCVHMSEKTPAGKGQLRIFNQIMETFSANELAEKVRRVGNSLGYNVRIDHLENPRKEAEEHYYNPIYHGLVEIGVEPHYLTDEALAGMFRVVERYKANIRKDVIFRGVKW